MSPLRLVISWKSTPAPPSNELEVIGVGPTEARMRIIVNGAGIAGPTLAYWLRRGGHDVVLIESAPQLRTGGYVIDFGLVDYDIAEKMGLIPPAPRVGLPSEGDARRGPTGPHEHQHRD
jgi:2-polyprenyl-6-methoxyphenol hydroxylase-like FAD-dependent oxidoreductase